MTQEESETFRVKRMTQGEKEIAEYFKWIIEKIKSDPLYKQKKEMGKLLMIPVESLTKEQTARLEQLKEEIFGEPK